MLGDNFIQEVSKIDFTSPVTKINGKMSIDIQLCSIVINDN